jgi:hypothetical protein
MGFLSKLFSKKQSFDPFEDQRIVKDIHHTITLILADSSYDEDLKVAAIDDLLEDLLPSISGDNAFSLTSELLCEVQIERSPKILKDVYKKHFDKSIKRAETAISRYYG